MRPNPLQHRSSAPVRRPDSRRLLLELLESRVVPSITLTNISPSVPEGNPTFTLIANGSGFAQGDVVKWTRLGRTTNLTTTFESSTQLQAIVPASLVTEESNSMHGVPFVAVFGNGETSNALPFTVTDAPLSATGGITFLAGQGTFFMTGVATFTDTGGAEQPSDYSATINWGDNTPTSNGTISGPVNGVFTVNGGHAYTSIANFTITVTIDHENAPPATVTDLASVGFPIFSISNISPNSVAQGSAGFTLSVFGQGFVSGEVVQFNGTKLGTTFVGSNQLQAFVPASLLTNAGTVNVVVTAFNPQGFESSNPATFTITPTTTPGAPVITSLNPSSVVASSSGFTLVVNGANFASPATVQLLENTTTVTISATVNSSNQLHVSVPGSILTPGTVSVTVSQGTGTSNVATLTVTSSAAGPTITQITPSSAVQGSGSFTMTVFGSGFANGATVFFNGVSVPTTFVNSSQLQATVPASSLTSAANVGVVVSQFNGQNFVTSNTAIFNITPSSITTPTITQITPSSAVQGSGSFTMTVFGSGFANGATVLFNGVSVPTTFVSSSRLLASVSSSLLTTAGNVNVIVSQNFVTSNTAIFNITQRVPSTLTATGLNITATANVAQVFTVAQFTDTAANAQPGAYAVPVDFGDGTPLQAGTVTQPGGPDTPFFVDATHTYTQTGTFTVHVRIFKEIKGFGETFSTATVGAAGGGARASSPGSNPLFVQAVGQGATRTTAASAAAATPVQRSAREQSAPSTFPDDLYWQRLGREERISDPNGWASYELALALEGSGSGS